MAVLECDALQPSEDDRVVRHHNTVLLFYSFVCNSFCKIDGEQDRIPVAPGTVEGCLEKKTRVVEGLIGETLWVELSHRLDDCARER